MDDVLKIRDENRQIQWAAAIQECKASGLSNKEYCIQHGFRIPAPGFLHTGRGGSKPPGSPGWRPLPGSKAFGLQQPTGYHLFPIHSYLLPSPTQVGDAGRVREPMYWYRVGSVSVCRHSSPRPWFPPCIKSGGLGNQCIGTGSVASLSVGTATSPPPVSTV